MPLHTHPTPFDLLPPAALPGLPALSRRAADLARRYADHARAAADPRAEPPPPVDDTLDLLPLGRDLWLALAAADPTLPDRLAAARAAAGSRMLPLVVRGADPAVRLLPWEALWHPDHGFLGRNPRFALSRGLPGPASDAGPLEPGPLRVLLFTCLPDDVDAEHARLDVEAAQATALQALGPAATDGRVELIMPDDGRFATFQALVAAHDPHVVFLFAHGRFHDAPGQARYGVIQFEADGGSERVSESRLAEVFAGRGARCVVLAACESGKGDSAQLSAGLVWHLAHEAGLPHVLGMRESVLERAALAFNAAFLADLVAGERVDVALQRGRAAITTPLAEAVAQGADPRLAGLSLGQWPLPALISHDPARPLINWAFTPHPPAPPPPGELLNGVARPARFIGRRRELRQWQAPFARGQRPVLLISGPGGQGKTALADKLARDCLRAWAAERAAPDALRPLVWSASGGLGEWDAFWVGLVERAGHDAFQAAAAGQQDETARADALLRLLLARGGGRLLVFLDNLETLQDPDTLALTDARVAAFLDAARALAPAGLRLLVTSRARPPGWPAAAELPLLPALYGDFLQMALAERAPAAFWGPLEKRAPDDAAPAGHFDRPRRIYAALNGNSRGIGLFAAAVDAVGAGAHGDDPAAAAATAFLDALAEATDRVRRDIALAALVEHLDGDARALLVRLPAYDVAAPLEGVLALALDLPDAAAALDRLLAVALVEPYYDPTWRTAAYRLSPLAAAWLAEQPGYALDPAWPAAAADYQAWLFEYERPTLEQAIILHRALTRAGRREAADKLALSVIVGPLDRAGQYRVLLDKWLPVLRESADDRRRAAALNWTSTCLHRLGDYALALGCLQDALAIYQTIGDRAGEGALLNNISGIYHAQGDYATALDYLQQSLAILQALGDRKGEGVTLNNISGIYHARGNYATALDYLQQSLAILQALGDRKGEGMTLNNISQIYAAQGDYATALDFLQRSLAIQQAIGDRVGEGTTLNNISQIYSVQGDYATALDYQQRSLIIQQAIGHRDGEGTALGSMAVSYYAQGDYATALDYLQRALAIQQAIGDRAGEGAALNNISQIYRAQGDYATALDFLQRALVIRQAIGDRAGEGAALNNISQIYLAQGDYATTLNYLQRALDIQQAIGDRAGEGVMLNNMAGIAHAQNDYTTALNYLRRSLRIAQAIGDRAGEGTTLSNMAGIAHAQGDYARALNYLRRALVIHQAIGDRAGEGTTLNNLSQIYQVQGDYVTALDYLQRALVIAQAIGNAAGLCATLFNIGHIHLQNDEPQEAMSAWLTSYRLARRLGLAQVLAELEQLAGQLGLPNGLAGWEALSRQAGE